MKPGRDERGRPAAATAAPMTAMAAMAARAPSRWPAVRRAARVPVRVVPADVRAAVRASGPPADGAGRAAAMAPGGPEDFAGNRCYRPHSLSGAYVRLHRSEHRFAGSCNQHPSPAEHAGNPTAAIARDSGGIGNPRPAPAARGRVRPPPRPSWAGPRGGAPGYGSCVSGAEPWNCALSWPAS